jgi:peptidoglycan/xylan/chitin deacetylase (PgdA/CDA1 family)
LPFGEILSRLSLISQSFFDSDNCDVGYVLSTELNTGQRQLCVLGYHKIGAPPANGWPTWFYIPEDIFVRQLSFLRDNAWEALRVETFIEGLAQPKSLPPKSVLLTFDDGYRSLLQTAVTWLRKFNCPADVGPITW